MLAALDARQLSEMYAFARIEPLDQPLQRMLAELTAVLAKVHGNEVETNDFMLVQMPTVAANDSEMRSQQIVEMFQAAARKNG